MASVLTAIGIGVGINAAFAPSAYGPPGIRFYAAFPAAPSIEARTAPAAHVRRAWTFTGTGHNAQLVVTAVALVDLPANEAVFIGTRHSRTPAIPPHDLRVSPTSVGGRPGSLVVGCLPKAPRGRDRCSGTLGIAPSPTAGDRVEWSAEASASSAALVKQLLASFLPAAG